MSTNVLVTLYEAAARMEEALSGGPSGCQQRIEVHLTSRQLSTLRCEARTGDWMDGEKAAQQDGTGALAIFGPLVIRRKEGHREEPLRRATFTDYAQDHSTISALHRG